MFEQLQHSGIKRTIIAGENFLKSVGRNFFPEVRVSRTQLLTGRSDCKTDRRAISESRHYQQLPFCHLFDGIANSLSPKSRVLHTPIRHWIYAERRYVANNQPTNLKFCEGAEHEPGITGEESSLKTVARAIDQFQSGIELRVRLNRRNRRKDLLGVNRHIGRCGGEQCWLKQGARSLAST